jgi:hypothetical protein
MYNILIMNTDLLPPFYQDPTYEDLLITLQLTHNTLTTHIAYDNDSYTWSMH